MKTDIPSRTAQYMALFRAIETARPSQKRLFDDPFASIFLDNRLKIIVKISSVPPFGRLISSIIQKKGPGALSSGIARTKYIDDLLQQTSDDGVKQVIILGAGFDTRALRLKFLRNISVIEIDHPDTARFKIRKLKNIMDKSPRNVKYYQLDFNKQSLNNLASKNNLDFDIPTTFIWEGVTNYLTQEAIDKTFQFIQKFQNVYVIFTYIDKIVLDYPKSFHGTEKIFKNLKENEENWTYGFKPIELPEYLKKFDLIVIEDLGAEEYRNKYISDKKNLLKGYEFYHVVFCKKKKKKKIV